MTRQIALTQAAEYFDSGRLQSELAALVAYRSAVSFTPLTLPTIFRVEIHACRVLYNHKRATIYPA